MQLGNRVQAHAGSGVPTADPLATINKPLFTAALAQNAALNGRIKLTEAIAAGRHARAVIQGITITSLDHCDWEVWFWRNSVFQGVAGAGEDFAGFYSFSSTGNDGKQIGAAGLYYYHVENLDIPYWDDDAQATPTNQAGVIGAFLNVSLVNRSVGGKTLNGWFDLSVMLQPTLGW